MDLETALRKFEDRCCEILEDHFSEMSDLLTKLRIQLFVQHKRQDGGDQRRPSNTVSIQSLSDPELAVPLQAATTLAERSKQLCNIRCETPQDNLNGLRPEFNPPVVIPARGLELSTHLEDRKGATSHRLLWAAELGLSFTRRSEARRPVAATMQSKPLDNG